MQRRLVPFLLGCVLFLFSSFIYAADTYKLDPEHTFAQWHISHFGFSHPSGKWYAKGTLMLDEKKPQNSKVDVTIQTADIDTGLPELDKHLKGKLFFDVLKYPQATFVSDKVTVTGKKTAKVQGVLTLHGVSKPVTLDVTLNQLGMSPITNKKTAGFTAMTSLKRSDFGINSYLPGLGDEVKINIEVEATQNTVS